MGVPRVWFDATHCRATAGQRGWQHRRTCTCVSCCQCSRSPGAATASIAGRTPGIWQTARRRS